MTQTTITPELIRAALAHIPATLPRDEWSRIGMAIKSEFADDTGLALFSEWSASADGFDAKAVRTTWRSVKAGGGVGIGTLIRIAQEHGFVRPQADQAAAPPDPVELARREREKAERQRVDQARQEAAHAAAAAEAVTLWAGASDAGSSPYLDRKGVQPHGVRFTPDGWLLVPLRDAGGALWNLQRIAPERPADGTDKLFLKGGRKSGLWHWCGDPAGAAVLLIAEGYATAATLHQATGRPVAVAFDAGNLIHVAKALRAAHPATLLVLCGDDDRQTLARAGKNVGRDKATAAAKAVRGLVVFPDSLPDDGSDFNDMHQVAGLDGVRGTVEAVIAVQQAAAQAALSRRAGQGASTARQAPGDPHAPQPYDRFYVDDDGVWITPPGDDNAMPRRVCGPLRVSAFASDARDNQAALLLEFDTQFKQKRRWLMPLSMLAGDGSAYRSALLSQGFMTPADSKRRGWLTE